MAQRAPLTQAEKQTIVEKSKDGMSQLQISAKLGCSWETVRKWLRYERDRRAPRPRGRTKRGPGSSFPEEIREKAVKLKKTHPHWGPKKVLVEMQPLFSLSKEDLPSPASLSVVFKQQCSEAVQPHQKRSLAPADPKVRRAHQRWQMDAKEGIPVGKGRANVQEIRDIYSGLIIGSQAFMTLQTDKGWQHLHREEHQQALRLAFCQWGLPLEVQTDNDSEFANLNDPTFPTIFTLWLAGLGIIHIRSRPHRPTDQSQVERNHRTQGDFVWKDMSFDQIEPFQQALDYHRQSYNEKYPSLAAHCHGKPPLSAFPSARTTGRPYHPDLEWDLFDLKRVDTFLAEHVWTRKVAANGTIHIGDQYYILGRKWKTKIVSIRFLPASRSFRFMTTDGSEIAVLLALGLEKEHLIGIIPAHTPLHLGFQFALPFQVVRYY